MDCRVVSLDERREQEELEAFLLRLTRTAAALDAALKDAARLSRSSIDRKAA
jgi:hypothetical protein